MSSVDNRVVHMTFDNAKFERDIAKTIASLDKLKAALDFSKVKTNIGDLSELSKLKMNLNATQFNDQLAEAFRGVDKLKNSLNFGATSKSFDHLTEATKKFNLNGMASAVAGVGTKFSALSVIGVTALATLASKAVTAGFNMAKGLTVAPILDGFREMETNMNSIQTILANTSSKGSTLDDVNKALAQLNEYSDQTIYNFSQMARNIGTFTAAGVDLDTSVNAIKGIANLAAISGSNSEQASSAMYQLSQALATGTLKLIDWNSVVNAGMGGEVFKNALFETGKALGTIADVPIGKTLKEWEDSGNNFRDSLQDGWITSEVLTTTLQAFTGDLDEASLVALGYTDKQAKEMIKLGALGKAAATEVKTLTQLLGTVRESVGSGWSQTFGIVFGDFEEAKGLFTGLSESIGAYVKRQAASRNTLLQGWKDLGGRDRLIKGLQDGFFALRRVLIQLRLAFSDVFPKITSERLFELTDKFAQFTENMKPSVKTLETLRHIFEGFAAVVEIAKEVISEVIGTFQTLFAALREEHGGGILDFFIDFSQTLQDLKTRLVDEGGIAEFFDDLTEKLLHPIESLKLLKDEFLGFFDGIDFGSLDGLTEAFQRVKDKVVELVESLGFDIKIPDKLTELFDSFTGVVDDSTSNSVTGGFDRLASIVETIGGAFEKVTDIAGKLYDALKKVDNVFGWIWDKLMLLKDLGVEVLETMWGFAKEIGDALSDGLNSDELQSVLDILDTIALLMGGRGIQSLGKNGLGINLAADLTGGNLPRMGRAVDQLGGVFGAFRTNLDTLTDSLKTMQTQIRANALLDIAKALALLTVSVLVLSFINPESIAKSLTAMAIGMGQLIGAVALLNVSASKAGLGPTGSIQLAGMGAALILLAGAMVVMAGALAILAAIKPEKLANGLLTLQILIVEMATAATLLKGAGPSLIAAGVGMMGIALAMNMMVPALMLFSTMSWEELGKGLSAVAGALVLIVGAVNLIPPSIILIGPGLVAVAFALNLMAASMLLFATMSWKDIGKGLVALGGGLALVATAMHLMPLTSIFTGPALIAVAVALTILGGALKIFATMSWEEIGKSMAVLGASLLILAAGLTLMQAAIPGAIALGIAAASLGLFTGVLKGMAKISWRDLGKGLAVMALSLAALGAAALILSATGAIPAIFLLGVALVALGAGFALLGVGAGLLAEAFKIIADAGTEGVDVLLYAIDALIVRIPDMLMVVIEALNAIALSMLEALPAIIEATGKIIQALLRVIIDAVPDIVEAGIAIVAGFLKVIRESGDDFFETGFSLLMEFLHGIEDNITDITSTVASIIEKFLEELARHIPDLVTAGASFLIGFLEGVGKNIDDVVTAGVGILTSFLEGVLENIDDIADTVGEIVTTLIEEIGELYGDIATAGADALVEFLGGLTGDARKIVRAATDLIIGVTTALADEAVRLANRMARVLIALLDGLALAIDNNDEAIGQSMRRLVRAMIEGLVVAVGADDIARALWKIGERMAGGIVTGFLNKLGIDSPSKEFIKFGGYITDGLVEGMSDSAIRSERAATSMATGVVQSFNTALENAKVVMEGTDEFNPTITPILDLSNVKATANQLGTILGTQPLQATASLQAANNVSAETTRARENAAVEEQQTFVREVKFEQNNYSPTQLNTATLYRQNRNQIELAKKELEVV